MEPTTSQIQAEVRELREELPQTLARAVAEGIRDVVDDKDLMQKFSRALYDELAGHTVNGASQWVGKRILTAFVVALTTAGIIWLVKTGALK